MQSIKYLFHHELVLVLTYTACIVLQMGSLVQKCRYSFKMMDLWPFSWSLLLALQTLNWYPALIRNEIHASTLSSTETVSSVVLITAWIVSGLYKPTNQFASLPFFMLQLSKQEKQQQRKEKSRSKGPSESSREKADQRSKADPSTSSGAEGDVSSEREP